MMPMLSLEPPVPACFGSAPLIVGDMGPQRGGKVRVPGLPIVGIKSFRHIGWGLPRRFGQPGKEFRGEAIKRDGVRAVQPLV